MKGPICDEHAIEMIRDRVGLDRWRCPKGDATLNDKDVIRLGGDPSPIVITGCKATGSLQQILKFLENFTDATRPDESDALQVCYLVGPQLGLATTREILDELRTRIELGSGAELVHVAGKSPLDYRTVLL